MNKTDTILKEIKESTGLEIINKSYDGIPLFNIPSNQPFKFYVTIEYNSIKGNCSFELHFPSLYIKSDEINEFAQTIIYVTSWINRFNESIKEDYNSKWVKQ